jgi:PadR family transcriptional regulator, regulatory protein PadR
MSRKPNTSPQTRDLLAEMSRKPRTWQYGYELSRQTGLASGTLYPLLIRLSDQGLLESRWLEPERPGKPQRHAYRLTATGLAFVRAIQAESDGSVLHHTGLHQIVRGATS